MSSTERSLLTDRTPLTEPSEDQCRICLESDIPTNMLHPCLCAGTNKFVHDSCLKQWIILSDNPDFKTKCPTCHHQYNITNRDINDNAIYCNSCYAYCTKGFLNSFLLNQCALIMLAFIIGYLDLSNSSHPSAPPIYNATAPIVHDISVFNEKNTFIVYYTFSCFLYVSLWILTISINIALLKNCTLLYLKKMNWYVPVVTPGIFYAAVYINMVSVVIGTMIITKLIQLWIAYHIRTIELIKTVQEYTILNYEHDAES